MSASDSISLAALVVSICALLVAGYAIKRANNTTSAATMVSLNESFRNAWSRYIQAPAEQRESELAELLNLLEIACAAQLEGSLSGNSAVLIKEYLNAALGLLINDAYAATNIEKLLQNTTTFYFIRRFLRIKRNSLSVTVPVKWYQA